MDRREAKRRAYFHAALALDTLLSDWEPDAPEGFEPYTEADVERITRGIHEIADALFHRARG